MKWLSRLFGFNQNPQPVPLMVCMRQEDTWCWPEHLGKQTEGICEQCSAPIFYEEQNHPFRKVCNRCAGYS